MVALGTLEEARASLEPCFLCNFSATVLPSRDRGHLTSKSALFTCFF